MRNVLVVSESNSVWGAERSLLQLARSAERNGVALSFLISRSSPLGDHLDKMGLPYSRHDFATHPALDSKGSLAKANILQLAQELIAVVSGGWRIWRKLRKFDSILVFSIWQAPEVILGARLARVPVDIDFHETFNNSSAMRFLGLIASVSRRVIVPSAVLARRSGLAASKRVTILPRPIEFLEDVPTAQRVGPLTVGVFGQIQPHKNVLEVARAVASVQGNLRLLVVGGNPNELARTKYENTVRAFISAMDGGSAVVDFVDDVRTVMRNCDVVINASEHEAFGRTIVESVSVGCYPISVGDWGPRETIQMLGVGHSLDRIDELPQLLAELLIRHNAGPLLQTIPIALQSFESENVSRKYFGILTAEPSK